MIDRATIESYFHDERYALGAKHLRTWRFSRLAAVSIRGWLQQTTFEVVQHEVLEETRSFESYGFYLSVKEDNPQN